MTLEEVLFDHNKQFFSVVTKLKRGKTNNETESKTNALRKAFLIHPTAAKGDSLMGGWSE